MKTFKIPMYIVLFLTVAASPFIAAQPAQTIEDFVTNTLVRSSALIATAEVAMKKSTSQEVKAYAQKITSEYSSINERTRELAERKNIAVPDSNKLQSSAEDLMLQQVPQNEFDVAYGKNQVPAIEHIIRLLQAAGDMGDPETTAFAESVLPHARRHLLMAEQLFATTSETRTDIYQDRENQIDTKADGENTRVPTTDRTSP